MPCSNRVDFALGVSNCPHSNGGNESKHVQVGLKRDALIKRAGWGGGYWGVVHAANVGRAWVGKLILKSANAGLHARRKSFA